MRKDYNCAAAMAMRDKLLGPEKEKKEAEMHKKWCEKIERILTQTKEDQPKDLGDGIVQSPNLNLNRENEMADEEKKVYDEELRGVLFKNNRKESPNHPDYTGNMTIEGKEYYMNGWVKESKTGNSFMSFSFKAKRKGPSPSKDAIEPESFF